MRLGSRDVRRSEGCPHSCIISAPVQAAFLVSAIFARRNPLGSTASSASTPVRRLLPIAAVPAAVAGLATAFAFGNGPAATAAVASASGHSPAAAAVPQTGGSTAGLVSFSPQSDTGLPVVRLNATRVAAIEPKGKHHRALPAKYVIKSGDTLASIAQHLYHSADYWPVLYWANHTRIRYASEIQAGQVLTVPAKPAKVPGAPKTLLPPAPAASTAGYGSSGSPASTAGYGSSGSPASTVGYGSGYSPASTVAAAPAQAASTYAGSSGSFQSCVIAAESGGNSQVMNSSGHYGLYQFSSSTWAAYGGNPADFGNASVAEQNQVFGNAIAAGGQSNWAPYDGC